MAAIRHNPKVNMLEVTYPKCVFVGGANFTCRLMTTQDRYLILTLAQQLSEADLLSMRRDITQAQAIDDWIHDVETGRTTTILVEDDREIVACGTLNRSPLFWNRHWAELSVMVRSAYRNRGLGTQLVLQMMAFARQMALEKVVVCTLVEDKGAQHMVEDLGFSPEAILPDWVKTRDNRTHDLLILALALRDNQLA